MKLKDSNKERAIIEHTLDIVYETGIAGVKMSVLAKRVGISPSTLYVYFKTKEDLIVSIGSSLLENISQGEEEAFAGITSFEKKFRIKWMHMLNFLMNSEKEVNFIDQWRQSPYFNKKAQQSWDDNKKVKSDLFKGGIDQGILKDLSEGMIHALMVGIAKQIVQLVKVGELKLDQETMDMSFLIVWDALKK